MHARSPISTFSTCHSPLTALKSLSGVIKEEAACALECDLMIPVLPVRFTGCENTVVDWMRRCQAPRLRVAHLYSHRSPDDILIKYYSPAFRKQPWWSLFCDRTDLIACQKSTVRTLCLRTKCDSSGGAIQPHFCCKQSWIWMNTFPIRNFVQLSVTSFGKTSNCIDSFENNSSQVKFLTHVSAIYTFFRIFSCPFRKKGGRHYLFQYLVSNKV